MRRFLRETYIGAIAVGMLFFYGLQAVIQTIENPYIMWLARKNQPSVLLAQQPIQYVNKLALYRTLGDAVIYLVAGAVLAMVIYSGRQQAEPEPKA